MREVMIMAENIDKSRKKNEEILAAITLANKDKYISSIHTSKNDTRSNFKH